MPTYDLIIRNGTIVDGTGAPRFTGDVAVKDGLIAAVGTVHGDAAQEIDAAGKIVDPRLCRCPHPLRWPGDLGSGNGPIELARRDHGGDGQLRGRLCPRRAGPARMADRADGRGGGHPRHRARRRDEVELGNLPRIPRCAGRTAAHGRCRHPCAARRGARLCAGRPRKARRGSDRRRHRARWPPSSKTACAPGRWVFRPAAPCCTARSMAKWCPAPPRPRKN